MSWGTPLERFWDKVDRRGDDDCWLWKGALNRYGYGKGIRIDGYQHEAHRASHMLLVGAIPSGLTIDHLCRVRHCVNPAHLEVVTVAENLHRRDLANVPKSSCRRGHPVTEQNTYVWITPRGLSQRHCLDCRHWREGRAA